MDLRYCEDMGLGLLHMWKLYQKAPRDHSSLSVSSFTKRVCFGITQGHSLFMRRAALFGSIGMTELIVIMVVALVVIGPKRLPEMARTLGKALGDFKRATSDFQSSFNLEDDYDLDVLDEDTKQQDKKANAGEQEPEEDEGEEEKDAADQSIEPDQAEAAEATPESEEATPESEETTPESEETTPETAATENEAAPEKTGSAREDETKT